MTARWTTERRGWEWRCGRWRITRSVSRHSGRTEFWLWNDITPVDARHTLAAAKAAAPAGDHP